MRTILLSGLRRSDELVFTSLLTLLSNNTDEKWEIKTKGSSDIVVVDVDTRNGLELARNLERCDRQVIRVTTSSDTDESALWLRKPVRSTEIIRCIAVLNESKLSSNEPDSKAILDVKSTYRLRRWPNKDIMNLFPEARQLAAVMIRRNLTLEEAMLISKQGKDSLMRFISLCKKYNFLRENTQHVVKDVTIAKRSAAPKNLFSKLRRKLMSK